MTSNPKQMVVGSAGIFTGNNPQVTCTNNINNANLKPESLIIKDSNNNNGIFSTIEKHGYTNTIESLLNCNNNKTVCRVNNFTSVIATNNPSPWGTAIASLDCSPGDGPQCKIINDINSVSMKFNYNQPGLEITNHAIPESDISNNPQNTASITLDLSGTIQINSTSTNVLNVNGNLSTNTLTYNSPLANINPNDDTTTQLNIILLLLKNSNMITLKTDTDSKML